MKFIFHYTEDRLYLLNAHQRMCENTVKKCSEIGVFGLPMRPDMSYQPVLHSVLEINFFLSVLFDFFSTNA